MLVDNKLCFAHQVLSMPLQRQQDVAEIELRIA
jgi:hypothetical protein